MTDWPAVTAILPSHGRPGLLRKAIAAILAQDYDGRLDVVVVHDREPVDATLAEEFGLRVRAVPNTAAAGLCGARNTGIASCDTELVAFCDDDDEWLAGKLRKQVERLRAEPDAVMSSTAIRVKYADTGSVRLAGTEHVTYDMLLVSRMTMLHSSSFVLRRAALLGDVGLLDTQLPGGMGEDWDLLLRAARVHPIAHVDQPLVDILWGSSSFFTRDWRMRLRSNEWFLDRYPQIADHPRGVARLHGQSAFFAAASGERRQAWRYVREAWRNNPREPRAWLSLPVIVTPRAGAAIIATLHRSGRGI